MIQLGITQQYLRPSERLCRCRFVLFVVIPDVTVVTLFVDVIDVIVFVVVSVAVLFVVVIDGSVLVVFADVS